MTRPATYFQATFPGRIDGLAYAAIVQWSVALLTALVGLMGVVHNTWPRDFRGPEFRLPLAFGIGMACFIAMRFYWHARPPAQGSDTRIRLTRPLSRLVYLTLFLLIGANQVLAVLNNHALAASATRLQGYLFAGIVSLALIRILALTAKAA
jgi:hypothetical protein